MEYFFLNIIFLTYQKKVKTLVNFCVGHRDSVCSLAFSTDGQLLASGSLDGIIQIWDVQSENLKCSFEGLGGGIEVNLLYSSRCTIFVVSFIEN